MTKHDIIQYFHLNFKASFISDYQYNDWLLMSDWNKFKYIGIDACQNCRTLFTHKPILKKIHDNYVWVKSWYQFRLFGCKAQQITMCDAENDNILNRQDARLFILGKTKIKEIPFE